MVAEKGAIENIGYRPKDKRTDLKQYTPLFVKAGV